MKRIFCTKSQRQGKIILVLKPKLKGFLGVLCMHLFTGAAVRSRAALHETTFIFDLYSFAATFSIT